MTAGIRNSIYDQRKIPGPGTYNILSNSRAPKFKFGQYIPTSYESDVPGPGTYQPNPEVAFKPISKKITFGVGERTCFANRRAPGPGTYEDSSRAICPRTTTIKLSTSSRNDTLNPYKTVGPGPARYFAKTANRMQGGKFSKAKRIGIYMDTVSPGPGAYPTKPLLGIGTAKPLLVSRRPDTTPHYGSCSPGPAQYKVTTKTCSQSFTDRKDFR